MKLIKTHNEENMMQAGPVHADCLSADSSSGHGGNIYKVSEETGIPVDRLVDFSASINPLGISDKVRQAMESEVDNLVNYPDPDTSELCRRIAEHHNIDGESIICGNGSTELIYLIPRALKPSKVLIPSPTFSEYEKACKLNAELRITNYELREEDNFKLQPQRFIEAMQGCGMAFLCNPNNPTGSLLTRKEVLEIAGAAKDEKCILVVDEAFIDFTPEESVIHDVQANPYLVVMRSMTKFYAITGLRLGYGVFHERLVGKVKEFKEPWTVNSLAQKAAIAALEDSAYAEESLALFSKEKAYMEKSLQEMSIDFLSSSANYYLLKTEHAGTIVKGLREKGILVRDCSNFKGLNSSYIRVAVKSHKHNELFVKELSGLCGA
jgi:threonine-phosphate decarboxylase